MKKGVPPWAIGLAVIALIGFCVIMYRIAFPSQMSEYDPQKYGPPSYVGGGGGQGGGRPKTPEQGQSQPAVPGQGGGQ